MSSEYKVDYHIHSYYSDGTMSPVELVRKYHDDKYDIISITDHDGIDGVKEALTAGEALRMQVLPGVEFSTQYAGYEIHILGYKFDPDNEELKETLEKLLGIHVGEVTYDGRFMLLKTTCFGACDRAPAVRINGKVYGNLDSEEKVRDLLESLN